MTRYLLDTNHASAVLRGKLDLLHHPKSAPDTEFGISLPSVGELWFMVLNSQRVQSNTLRLRSILVMLAPFHFDERAAIDFGQIMIERRRMGRPISGIDCQIAAIARVNDLILLTDDGDFSPILGLKQENWLR